MQEQVAAREETKASEPRYKMKIEKDVDVPMRDGAKLKADVFRPDGDGHPITWSGVDASGPTQLGQDR